MGYGIMNGMSVNKHPVESSLLPASDIRLNGISREVTPMDFRTGRIEKVAAAMLATAQAERDPTGKISMSLVGLAAPQIGEFIRVILFDKKSQPNKTNLEPQFQVIVNPQIIRSSKEEELGREGCYSTGDIKAAIYRAKSVVVTGMDTDRQPVALNIEDSFHARIVQHEVDHLNGVRCPDRVRAPEHLHIVKPDEFQDYREQWQSWSTHAPVEDWLAIKNGSAG